MRNPRVMPELVGGLAPLPELLKEECRRRGAAPEEREAIAGMLPANLRAAPGFLDRLTARWRYDFGLPYENLRGGGTMIGTPMHPPVDKLLDVLVFIRSRLSPEKLAAYFHRLDQPGKHEDVLFECAPVLRLDPSMQVEHEAEGYGCEGATIDWAIGPQDDWEQDVHALAQSGEIKAATLATLRAVESDRFVFRSAR